MELSFPCFILTDTPLISVCYVSHLPPYFAPFGTQYDRFYKQSCRFCFSAVRVLFGSPTPCTASTSISGLPYSLPYCYCRRYKASVGHTASFRTMPPANTLVRRVNWNAFAPIVQARPCPIFGRPVHQRNRFHRLRPGTSPQALQTPPYSGRPAL